MTTATAALYEFRLPFPPSINELYADVIVPRKKDEPRGKPPYGHLTVRRIKTAKGNQYVLDVEAAILSQLGERPILPLNTELWLEVEWHKTDLHKYDLDGPLKSVIDAMFSCLNYSGCKNDAWIVDASVKKVKDTERYAVVRIGEALL